MSIRLRSDRCAVVSLPAPPQTVILVEKLSRTGKGFPLLSLRGFHCLIGQDRVNFFLTPLLPSHMLPLLLPALASISSVVAQTGTYPQRLRHPPELPLRLPAFFLMFLFQSRFRLCIVRFLISTAAAVSTSAYALTLGVNGNSCGKVAVSTTGFLPLRRPRTSRRVSASLSLPASLMAAMPPPASLACFCASCLAMATNSPPTLSPVALKSFWMRSCCRISWPAAHSALVLEQAKYQTDGSSRDAENRNHFLNLSVSSCIVSLLFPDVSDGRMPEHGQTIVQHPMPAVTNNQPAFASDTMAIRSDSS